MAAFPFSKKIFNNLLFSHSWRKVVLIFCRNWRELCVTVGSMRIWFECCKIAYRGLLFVEIAIRYYSGNGHWRKHCCSRVTFSNALKMKEKHLLSFSRKYFLKIIHFNVIHLTTTERFYSFIFKNRYYCFVLLLSFTAKIVGNFNCSKDT